MRRASALVALAIGLSLAACTNTTDKVLTEQVCIESHSVTTFIMTPISCGQNCTSFMTTPVTSPVCDRHINIVRPNPNYREAAR